MYLHLGRDTTVRTGDIIGIFDIENTSVGKLTREYLAASEKRKSTVNVSFDMPKSFVVSTEQGGKERVYISPVAPATLKKRAERK